MVLAAAMLATSYRRLEALVALNTELFSALTTAGILFIQ